MTDDVLSSELPFTPVPVRARHDGWTPDRQTRFIVAIAESGCVADAAKAVGMTRKSAYRLRERPGAESFARAWDDAMEFAVAQIEDGVRSRALHGVATPIFYKGRQVGERRRWDERLAISILTRHYRLADAGAGAGRFGADVP